MGIADVKNKSNFRLGGPFSKTSLADRGMPPNLGTDSHSKALGHPLQIFFNFSIVAEPGLQGAWSAAVSLGIRVGLGGYLPARPGGGC